MIPLEKLRQVTTIVTHDTCPDGLASAMILLDVLPKAEVVFCQYSTPLHKSMIAKPGMLFADFSPDPARIQEFIDQGAIVLDHHKTAKDTVLACGELGVFADEKEDPGVSGAVLAFREVWLPLVQRGRVEDLSSQQKIEREAILESYRVASSNLEQQLLAQGLPPDQVKDKVLANEVVKELHERMSFKPTGQLYDRVSKFARLAGIRDTWQKNSDEWLEAWQQAEALMFWPREQWLKAPIFWEPGVDSFAARMAIGPIQVSKFQSQLKKVLDGAFYFEHKGVRCCIFQGSRFTSDGSEALRNRVDLVVGWDSFVEQPQDMQGWPAETAKGPKTYFSCRSRGTFDASQLAKANGGGGHTSAAAFSKHLKAADLNAYSYVEKVITTHIDSL